LALVFASIETFLNAGLFFCGETERGFTGMENKQINITSLS
jgi:hypothetical protein